MTQLAKSLHYRKSGAVTGIPLFSAATDTSGSTLPLRVDSAAAYAQLVPETGGYGGTDLKVRKTGSVYRVANMAFPTVTEYNGNPNWYHKATDTIWNYRRNVWYDTVKSLDFYVPHQMNVAIYCTFTGYYWSSESQYGQSYFLVDGNQLWTANRMWPSYWYTYTPYNGNMSFGPGQHNMEIKIWIESSYGDESSFECTAATLRTTLTEP